MFRARGFITTCKTTDEGFTTFVTPFKLAKFRTFKEAHEFVMTFKGMKVMSSSQDCTMYTSHESQITFEVTKE